MKFSRLLIFEMAGHILISNRVLSPAFYGFVHFLNHRNLQNHHDFKSIPTMELTTTKIIKNQQS